MNKAFLIGRLTKDPELKYTPTGLGVCDFTVAVTRPFKKEETDFLVCKAWRKLAEILCQWKKKGDEIMVEGYIYHEKYQTKEGANRTTTRIMVQNIEFLRSKLAPQGAAQPATAPPALEKAPPEPPGYKLPDVPLPSTEPSEEGYTPEIETYGGEENAPGGEPSFPLFGETEPAPK